MSTALNPQIRRPIVYPESDGKPMADNTRQFQYIVMIQGGLDWLFQPNEHVFVAGDLLWYPVEGRPEISVAPDALVVFGRPKGHRGSYLQWLEDGIPPQVVFEVLSPSNRASELARKLEFYERYGVEECYFYDPDTGDLSGWRRHGNHFQAIAQMQGWVSPRLGVKFEIVDTELRLTGPDGRPFATYLELAAERVREAQQAQLERQRAEQAGQRAEQARQRADRERERADRLAEKLRSLGITPEETP